MKKLFALLSLASVLMTGCSSDDAENVPAPSLKLSSRDAAVTIDADGLGVAITADARGVTVMLDIETNLDAWSLTEEIPSWITAVRTESRLTLAVSENTKTQAREAELKVSVGNKSGRLEATISVAQAGIDPATLELSAHELDIPGNGGSVKLNFESNQTAIDVQDVPEWLSFTPGDGWINFTADANETGAPLVAEVTIVAGAGDNTATEKVTVTQDVPVTLDISDTSLTIPAGGGSAILTYTTNQSTVDVRKSAEWLSFTKRDGSVEFTAEANQTGSPLSTEVTIVAGQGDKTTEKKVTVSQDPFVRMLSFEVVVTDNSREISLPTLSTSDSDVFFSVDLGDGNSFQSFVELTSGMKHQYQTSGTFTVTISTNNVITAFSFYRNASLKKIVNNTLDMSGVMTLSRCFSDCPALEEVAVNTIAPCVNATNADYMFYNCKVLTTVPAGLLSGLTKIKSFNYFFQKCVMLSSVPEGFFAGYKEVTAFNSTFAGTAITSVPSRCFAGCSAVTRFGYTFNECKALQTIAADAFEGCTNVKEFYATFTNCSKLQAIPEGLFSKMMALSGMEYCFQYCSSLQSLPAALFDNNRNLRYLDYSFMDCTSLRGESPYTMIDGVKVHLYERKNYPDAFVAPSSYEGCFRNDEALTDYATIAQNGWI